MDDNLKTILTITRSEPSYHSLSNPAGFGGLFFSLSFTREPRLLEGKILSVGVINTLSVVGRVGAVGACPLRALGALIITEKRR